MHEESYLWAFAAYDFYTVQRKIHENKNIIKRILIRDSEANASARITAREENFQACTLRAQSGKSSVASCWASFCVIWRYDYALFAFFEERLTRLLWISTSVNSSNQVFENTLFENWKWFLKEYSVIIILMVV